MFAHFGVRTSPEELGIIGTETNIYSLMVISLEIYIASFDQNKNGNDKIIYIES